MKRQILTALAALAISASALAGAPKYIFYFIGDGMGMGPVMSAMTYKRMAHPEQAPLTMTQFPVAGWCQTWSASTPVTDSAAAGTALSSGSKTKNGMLGMNADTLSVTSMATILKEQGWGIGVLTTVAPDDATPGAFYAHVPKRSMYYDIDIQAARCGYEFLGGASLRGLTDKEGKTTDVLDVMAENDVKIVYGPEGLEQIADANRVIVLGNPETNLNNNDLSYTIDSVAGAITLPRLTQACLAHLERLCPDRFFMMVEGGNIDHALHANDGAAATKEIIQFDKAVAIAYEFYKAHPDETLIVITADHDTGGMTVGNKALSYNARPEYFDYQKISKEAFGNYCQKLVESGNIPTWDEMKKFLTDNFGFWAVVPVDEKNTELLKTEFDNMVNKVGADEKTLYASFNTFAVTVYRLFNDAAGIGFTTTSHTGNPVPVFAIGSGADKFTGVNNNTEIPATIYELATGRPLKMDQVKHIR